MTDWTYSGLRIFTQDLRDDVDNIIARLNPLGGGTILHKFGDDERITKLSGLVVGLTDKLALEAIAATDDAHDLVTPYGTWGSYYLKHASFQLTQTICQTLRPDLDENSPVFKVDCEFYREI